MESVVMTRQGLWMLAGAMALWMLLQLTGAFVMRNEPYHGCCERIELRPPPSFGDGG
jgi:hypothetical protein